MLTHRLCLVDFLAPSQNGKTAIHFAAYNGHVAAMEFLLAHGADPKAEDEVRAPLEAYWLKKEGIMEERVQRCTRAVPLPEPTEVMPSRALLWCACLVLMHRPFLVPFLAPSQYCRTAFHYAAENGHVAAMEFLLAHGADPKANVMVRALLEAYWLEKEGIKEGRVQRCTRACHERCTGTHEPPAQALRSPRRTQSHET